MVRKLSRGPQHAGGTVKILCQDVGIEGHFHRPKPACDNSNPGTAEGNSRRFVMKRTGQRDIIIKYQRPDTSSKIEILKKFDCCGQFFTLNRLFPWIFSRINLNS